jgi:hypothetical protein
MRNPFPKLASAALALAFALTFAACSGGDDPVPVESVSVAPTTLDLRVGGAAVALTAAVLPADASDRTVAWSSDAPTIASVTGSGASATVTAVGNGTTIVTAAAANGKNATCVVTVTTPATGVELDSNELTLRLGDTHALTATVLPTTASNKAVTWSSSDTGVATVSEGGLVTALAIGGATITATAADGGFADTCAVTVASPVTMTPHKTLAANYSVNLAIKADGSLWAWGYNQFGQLGLGDMGAGTDRLVPTQVGDDKDWASVAVGDNSSAALKSDGSVWAWGRADNGSIGNGAGASWQLVPVQVGADKDWRAVAATNYAVAAIKEDGSLWCWGGNHQGQCGQGSAAPTSYYYPVQVGEDRDWVAVNGERQQFRAVKADGSLWAWGQNINNAMGTGDDDDRHSPTRIGADSDWICSEQAYDPHTVGVKHDGSVWVNGWNNFRIFGNGQESPSTMQPYPTMVGTDTDWAFVSSAWSHILAIKTDGSLWTWGSDTQGSLGELAGPLHVPTRVGEASDWVAVEGGGYHSLALKVDGSLWTWGYNVSGQIGNGTKDNQLEHFKVGDGWRVPAK